VETAFQIFASGLFVLLLAVCAISVIVLIAGAVWIYGDAQRRGMDAAVWVILLIVATLLGTVIGFVIVIVVYLVVRGNHPIGGGFPVGYGPYPPYPPPAVPAACPVCGNPMTWYPQYNRWYCPHCAQYR
jgi:hypothetical protein